LKLDFQNTQVVDFSFSKKNRSLMAIIQQLQVFWLDKSRERPKIYIDTKGLFGEKLYFHGNPFHLNMNRLEGELIN
jgi:hypothetical protein